MSEPRPQRRVLLIGGHVDGQWADVDPNAITHRVMKPLWNMDDALQDASDVTIPMPEFVDYRIERMPIAIHAARADIWIGTLIGLRPPERDLAIVRAIFQRDVAAHFKEAW